MQAAVFLHVLVPFRKRLESEGLLPMQNMGGGVAQGVLNIVYSGEPPIWWRSVHRIGQLTVLGLKP